MTLKIIDLNRSYEGYIWVSDKTAPEEIIGTLAEKWPVNDNPFVVEGWLLDKDAMKSYYVKMVDGQYLEYSYDISEDDVKDSVFYDGKRMKKQLGFHQVWEKRTDDLCEGMDVLEPGALVFTGFKK